MQFNVIQGTGLRTGPTCMPADPQWKKLTWGTRTHVWADDGFGTLHIVDRDKAYNGCLANGFVQRAS